MEEIIDIYSLILGAILTLVGGVIIIYLTKNLEEKRTKKYITKVILFEVTENQNLLLPLANTYLLRESIIGNIQLLNEINFDRTVYSAVSDKIGLIHADIAENIVKYYTQLKIVEEKSRQIVSSQTQAPMDDEKQNQMLLAINKDRKVEWYKKSKETYTIGEELIKNLEK